MDIDDTELIIDDDNSIRSTEYPTIYSWGRADLYCLLYKENSNNQCCSHDGVYSYRTNSNRNIISISSNQYHTCCVTSTGELYTCGSNYEGAISDEQGIGISNDQLQRPKLFESLSNHKIVSVSCGLNHTVCLTSAGIPLSFGNNEVGQLGHSPNIIRNVKPRTVSFNYGKSNNVIIIHKISCGDLFSLFLTTQGEVFGTGSGLYIGGNGQGHVSICEKIDSLIGSNIVNICSGSTFSFALDFKGVLFGFGNNSQGQLGIPQSDESLHIQIPTIITNKINNVIGIAAGSSHSLIWNKDGLVFGSGNNKNGQIGVSSVLRASEFEPLDLPYPCILASCGANHSILLCNDNGNNKIFGMGSNVFGNITSKSTSTMIRVITEIDLRSNWKLDNIYYIAAGGDQSFAVGVSDNNMLETSALLKKQFSTRISKATVPMTTTQLNSLITSTISQKDNKMVMGTTLSIVTELMSSPSLLAGSFIDNGTLDVLGLEKVYTGLLQLGNSSIVRLFGALMNSLVELEKLFGGPSPPSESSIRVIMIIWQSPLCSMPTFATDLFSRLIKMIMTSPFSYQEKLFSSFSSQAYPSHIFVSRILKSLHENLSYDIDESSESLSYNTPYYCVCLNAFYEMFKNSSSLPLHLFYNDGVSALSSSFLYADYKRYNETKSDSNQSFFAVSKFPFLLSIDAKRRLIMTESTAEQHRSAMQGLLRSEVPYFIMEVRRSRILQDTLNYIQAINGDDLYRKPLRVIFSGEEAVDEGGVKKEFFQLLVTELFNEEIGAFIPTPDHRSLWLNKAKLHSEDEYRLIGIVLGLGIYSDVLLDVHFPTVIYKKILNKPVGLDDLLSIDPDLHKGLVQLLDYPNPEEVEYVFCQTFSVEWDYFGEKQLVEFIPDGSSIPVTGDNRQEYVDKYVQWILVDSISTQFASFVNGFYHFIDTKFQSLLRPEELELLLVGLPHLDFKELEESTQYIGPDYWNSSFPLIRSFWETVHAMSFEEKQKLLKFVTGSTKSPVNGLKSIGFKIQREAESDNLPTSHTCFNVLVIPEYRDSSKLKERLLIAIESCEGFGFA